MPVNRRDLLTGAVLAATQAAAQPATADTLYIPQPHRVEDRALLHDFMDEYAFVDLITSAPSLRITHIPALLDRAAGPYGTLYGHVARANPQSRTFDGRQSAVMVFRGPHAYISPTWYTKAASVPTWNFAVVHASGRPEPVVEKPAARALLARLIRKFEDRYGKSSYDFAALPQSYVDGMIGGIVAFSMRIDSIEGKFKLGQERSERDRQSLLKNLEGANEGRSMHDFTAAFYERTKKAGPA